MDYDQATREKRRRTSERVGTQIHMREPSDSPTIPFCNPPSPPPETMDTKKWAVLMRGWKTSVTLVGFYISACTLAIVHYTIFAYLDRRVIGSSHDASLRSTDVPQSYVTTTSLVLVTAFRAALAGSIGIAYTQYLWKNLRSSLLSVSIIEELFQIRNNPLRLMNYTLLLSTPTLLVIATFSWVVPTAMIYPPGALVVGLEGRNVPEKFNVSGFQPNDTVSKDSQLGTYNGLAEVRPMCHGGPHTRVCNYTYRLLERLTASVLTSAKVADLPRLFRRDYSYSLDFQGPLLQCHEAKATNLTTFHQWDFQSEGASILPERILKTPMPTYRLSWNSGRLTQVSITKRKYNSILYSPCNQILKESSSTSLDGAMIGDVHVLMPLTIMTCSAATARYNVNISFTDGVQTVNYSMAEVEPMPLWYTKFEQPRYIQSFDKYINILALIDSLVLNFNSEDVYLTSIPYTGELATRPPRKNEFHLLNGSSVTMEVCELALHCGYYHNKLSGLIGRQGPSQSPLIAWTPFNKSPSNSVLLCLGENLAINENSLNEALANITISALSLDTWIDVVNGTVSKKFNVYLFNNKLTFFLPYGLCLLFAIPIVVIGLTAHCDNGVSAIDGGFLQILMTTTGRTKLEKHTVRACLGGLENIPEELKQLKIRFGEMRLQEDEGRGSVIAENVASQQRAPENVQEQPAHQVSSDTISLGPVRAQTGQASTTSLESGIATQASRPKHMRRAGFGTLEETRPLEKGVRYGSDTI